MSKVDLSTYQNWDYNPGSALKRMLWYVIGTLFFQSGILPSSTVKVFILKVFGAKIGKGVVIKPFVQIKYPWFLSIGDHVWIGEKVWIDNLAQVSVGSNVCISQGAMLLTGNHNYKLSTFDLITQPIELHEGAWVGARSTVTPGTIVHTHAMLTVGSVSRGSLQPFTIYSGVPAVAVRKRAMA